MHERSPCPFTEQQGAESTADWLEAHLHVCAPEWLQGMLLLAGSTTVYDLLPSAGEKKKEKLQVCRRRDLHTRTHTLSVPYTLRSITDAQTGCTPRRLLQLPQAR